MNTMLANGTAISEAEEDFQNLRNALVMMVDDEPLNIEMTQIFLEDAGYRRFVSTSDSEQAMSLLDSERPDVLLLDLKMPKVSGFDILTQLRSHEILKHIPTIVLTSSSESETKLKALELGAMDFLSKPVDPSELALRLRNTLAAKAYRDHLAYYDPLTGLPNRRMFIDRLDWLLRQSQRDGTNCVVLQIGIDRFKQINEAFGPALGDELLKAIARRLEQCVRSSDLITRLETEEPQRTLFRLSGDEFIVVLPSLPAAEAAAVIAQRVLAGIAITPFILEGQEVFLTSSIGIAVFPLDAQDKDSLLKQAGIAMHYVKDNERNQYQYYSNELNNRSLRRLSLESELRKALDNEELELYYQPKVDVKTNRLTGAEALVRWIHPLRGLISPAEFIPLAEDTGLITPLGEYVLHAACQQIRAWELTGLTVNRIAVNVSSQQFRYSSLPEVIVRILESAGIDSLKLTLELTETLIMDNADENIKTLHKLKEIGVKLSIDDFGTGYSSLSYLKKFPLDELKIDRSFITNVDTDADNAAIIRAIIVMAQSLGLSIVAEGVETQQELAVLRTLGCEQYQGYLFSKPIPAKQFTSVLASL